MVEINSTEAVLESETLLTTKVLHISWMLEYNKNTYSDCLKDYIQWLYQIAYSIV